MAFATVQLKGGPCDGRYIPVTEAQLAVGFTTCGGVVYQFEGVNPGVYIGVPQISGSGGTLQQFAPDLFAGYEHLRRSVVKRLRPAVTTALRYDQLALRALNSRHKVRG